MYGVNGMPSEGVYIMDGLRERNIFAEGAAASSSFSTLGKDKGKSSITSVVENIFNKARSVKEKFTASSSSSLSKGKRKDSITSMEKAQLGVGSVKQPTYEPIKTGGPSLKTVPSDKFLLGDVEEEDLPETPSTRSSDFSSSEVNFDEEEFGDFIGGYKEPRGASEESISISADSTSTSSSSSIQASVTAEKVNDIVVSILPPPPSSVLQNPIVHSSISDLKFTDFTDFSNVEFENIRPQQPKVNENPKIIPLIIDDVTEVKDIGEIGNVLPLKEIEEVEEVNEEGVVLTKKEKVKQFFLHLLDVVTFPLQLIWKGIKFIWNIREHWKNFENKVKWAKESAEKTAQNIRDMADNANNAVKKLNVLLDDAKKQELINKLGNIVKITNDSLEKWKEQGVNTQITTIIKNMSDLSKKASEISSKFDQEDVKKMISNISSTIAQTKEIAEKFNTQLKDDDLKNAMKDLSQIAGTLNGMTDTIKGCIDRNEGKVDEISNQLEDLLGQCASLTRLVNPLGRREEKNYQRVSQGIKV